MFCNCGGSIRWSWFQNQGKNQPYFQTNALSSGGSMTFGRTDDFDDDFDNNFDDDGQKLMVWC